jgi:hypothetical protein
MCSDTQNAQITEAERPELLWFADENIQSHETVVHTLTITESKAAENDLRKNWQARMQTSDNKKNRHLSMPVFLFGVPTGIRFLPTNNKPHTFVLTTRWVDYLRLSPAAQRRKFRRLNGLPPTHRGYHCGTSNPPDRL